jgi:gliding-associated putative ABC transporter substrate-binding component GldG
LGLIIGIALFLNILGSAFFTHFDFTEDRRFTLTRPTRELLRQLDDVVYVDVLLEGEFPAGFKRLQRSVKEMLSEFRMHSGYIEYKFTDPGVGTAKDINARRTELAKDGISPTNLTIKSSEGREEKLIYPYAKIIYKGRTAVVDLLDEDARGRDPEEQLNTSISELEYKFANAMHKLQLGAKEIIGFTVGHGELNELERKSLVGSLRSYYEVGTFNLDSATFIPQEVKVLVVAKPRRPFSDRDLFLIDQYVMNGGKIIWLIDALNVELDSMRNSGGYVAVDYPLNLNDLLFRYGARVNPDLVLDWQSSRIPMVIDQKGTQELFKWYYHPIVIPQSDHPAVKNLDGINLYFPSSIDTIKTRTPVKKTVLLTSSERSKVQPNVTRLSFEILRYGDELVSAFNKKNIPVAVMLEGTFPSYFENRLTAEMEAGLEQVKQPFKPVSVPTRMAVVSDGDIARNLVSMTGQVMPLGFNQFERFQFSNKDFMLNLVEYLRDDQGIIEARGREVRLRLLDSQKAGEQELLWQLVNIVAPLLLLVAFGLLYNWRRKRRFAL